MNIRRIIAGVMCVCVMGTVLPSVGGKTAYSEAITASAADYTEGTDGVITYRNYGDYIEITDCERGVMSIDIPAEIDGLPVTGIRIFAFGDCQALLSVTIPDSVTRIGDSAFCGCTRLTQITIPDSVTVIEGYAFEDTNLTEIVIPDSVTDIGENAFIGTPWLESKRADDPLVIVNGILIDGTTCSGNVVIPDSVVSISESAFYECAGLTGIIIPDSVERIGLGAFCHCAELKEITMLNPDCKIYDDIYTITNGYDNDRVFYNGTIYGYDNSTAQAYAEKYERKFVSLGEAPTKDMLGDVNGDGMVDSSDASLVLTEYALLSTGGNGNFSESVKKLADLDKDGTIDSSDASLILAYYAAMSTGKGNE